MKFYYQARTKTGKIEVGTVQASDKEAAADLLKQRNLYVTALEEAELPIYAKQLTIFQKARKKDIVFFSRQFAIMLKANVPVLEALRAIAKQTKKRDFRDKILKIASAVEGGSTLSQAFALFPKLFDTFYISMIKSGEASGKLSEIFSYLADNLEKEANFRGKVIGALIYPAFVVVVFFGVFFLITLYIIPQISVVLKETKTELPLVTRAVMWFSDFLKNNVLFVLLGIILLIVGFFFLSRNRRGRKFFHTYALKIPLLRSFLKKIYLSRFALNLSTLISGGLPIVQALEITAEVVVNEKYKEIILKTRDAVKRGEKMSVVLAEYPDLIPPLFYQMVLVGEKTGTLDSSLKNLVSFYQEEVARALSAFTRLLEPIMIIVLGGMVLGLMAAVMIPLYSISF